LSDLFPGFEAHWIDTRAGRIFARSAGEGPPLLLLHGFPQTGACWHRIAPALARTHRVVVMDLRGYGWSSAPRGDPRHETYAKRAMGEDAVAVMERLGAVRFALVGHDRGARVGYRLALDHPGRVERLALLDILPTAHVWSQIRAGTIPGAHWAYLSQAAPIPEEEIGRDPTPYFEGLMAKWTLAGTLDPFDPRALRAYRDGCNEPTRIHAFCEDYRAGATRDVEADEADLAAARTIGCPTFVAWGDFFLTGQSPETPLDVWRRTFAPGATGAKIAGAGHFLPEENPDGLLAALEPFLAA
jgi:haloacetate dehalogenase